MSFQSIAMEGGNRFLKALLGASDRIDAAGRKIMLWAADGELNSHMQVHQHMLSMSEDQLVCKLNECESSLTSFIQNIVNFQSLELNSNFEKQMMNLNFFKF